MEQVRELLFGEAKRSTEQTFGTLEKRLEAMQAEFAQRFAALEQRLAELSRDTARERAESVEAIGSAITQLGAHVRALSRPQKGG
jgi:predicted phage gp36 major capsid-like protein